MVSLNKMEKTRKSVGLEWEAVHSVKSEVPALILSWTPREFGETYASVSSF